MAGEVKIPFSSAFNLYFVHRNQANDVWYIVGQVFEVWGTDGRDADDYDAALIDDAGGMHVGDFDTNIPLGHYIAQAYIDTGTPVDGDDSPGAEEIWWNGTSEETQTQFELKANNLDHLMKTAVGNNADMTAEVTDGTVLSNVLSKTSDTSTYEVADDSLEANRDHIGDGTNLTEAGGDGNHLTAIDLPNQTMDITGNIFGSLAGSVGSVAGNVDGNVTGTVTGKTPAEAGDEMNLAADAIKDVSYDETTAFPVKSEDSGSTEIARTGADGDTLETLSDEIAAQATPNDISVDNTFIAVSS